MENKKIRLVVMILIVILLFVVVVLCFFRKKNITTNAEETKDDEYIQTEIADSPKWTCQYDMDTKNITITNGETIVEIGDFINYNPVDNLSEETVTQYSSTKSNNGYSDQKFSLTGNKNSYDTEKYGWQILGVSDAGELLIVSEDLIYTTSGKEYYLKGKDGYTNLKTELDAICSLYGHGYGSNSARSITVEDINALTGYNPVNAGTYDPEQLGMGKKINKDKINEYGNEVTYSREENGNLHYTSTNGKEGNSKVNNLYWFDNTEMIWRNFSEREKGAITLSNTNYNYYAKTLTENDDDSKIGIEENSKEYKMLFTDAKGENCSYWLSSPCVNTNEDSINFCIRNVVDGHIQESSLYKSDDKSKYNYYGIRAVVLLSTDIQLTENSDNGWSIVK